MNWLMVNGLPKMLVVASGVGCHDHRYEEESVGEKVNGSTADRQCKRHQSQVG